MGEDQAISQGIGTEALTLEARGFDAGGLRELLGQGPRHECPQPLPAPRRRGIAVGADLPVMRINVVDHERCVAGEAEQKIGRQCRKSAVPMRQFMRDRGSGEANR